MNTSTTKPPPTWVLEPATAWIYLAASVGLALTPAFPFTWLVGIAAAIFTYRDRRAHGFPAFWWTAAVAVFGAFAYIFFIYKRTRGPIVFTPHAAVSQQGRLLRDLPPLHAGRTASTARTPAGWYANPTGDARIRYWNGSNWTDHTAE